MSLLYRNSLFIRENHPMIADAFDDVLNYVEGILTQANLAKKGFIDPPPPITSITLTTADGVFDIAIVDNSSSVARGINYFVEYSTTPIFSAPTVLDLGASRNYRTFLGNQTLYFRAYSAYPASARSAPVYFGTAAAPTAAVGGGALPGPAPQASSGSGTSIGADPSDGGFGRSPRRGFQIF